ncbi:MAG: pyrroline-5-carboxylate reductase [Burkholderiaceae bacterium]
MANLVFIGGGNMASAILGGLVTSGTPASSVLVVEPFQAQRDRLHRDFGVATLAQADASIGGAELVVWAVKPQLFASAAAPCAAHVGGALHLSVMAGIRSDTLARTLATERIVRAMPNTPALIGQGIAGLYARAAVRPDERERVERLLAPTGRTLWVGREEDLDAVTALSGSGPAYVFYVIEAMVEAAVAMGLSAEQGKALTLATLAGATALAQSSADPPALLRERVTSKGGTTDAALQTLEAGHVKAIFIAAMQAAQRRARTLGDEFG